MNNTNKTHVEITQLMQENSSLITHISSLESENTSIKEENLELKAKNSYYEEQFRLMQKKKYGTSSERITEGQLSIFDDMLNEAESQSDTRIKEPDTAQITYSRNKRDKDNIIKNLPIVEVHHVLDKEALVCDTCSHPLHDMGTIKRDEIEIIPAKVMVKRHITHKYSCRNCETTGTSVDIIQPDTPNPLIKGSMATPSAVSHIMTQKYMNAVPLYRQEKYLRTLGVKLSRQTMSNWIIKSSDYLKPVYERLHKHLLKQDIIHADETPLQVLREENRKAKQKSYMWLYKSGRYDDQIVLYDYKASRNGDNPRKFLNGYGGYLQTDGYAAYNKLKNITQVGCLAHVRRKFKDAMDVLKDTDAQKESMSYIGFSYCNKLYSIEKNIKDFTLEERNAKRMEFSVPIFKEFQDWVSNQINNSLPRSAYGKALTYANNQMPKVKNYLLDPRLQIDNNSAERSIKPFVIGRKNWLFSNTAKGAESSAIIYSIVETAKENNLRVHEYLQFLFTELKDMDNPSVDDLDRLLPWSDNLPGNCCIDA